MCCCLVYWTEGFESAVGVINITKETQPVPNFKVVAHQPWRRVVVVVVTIVLSVSCLSVGYTLGQYKMAYDGKRVGQLKLDLQLQTARANETEARLVDAELSREVQKAASNELRVEFKTLHQEVARLGEEVTLYKRLMSPGDVQQGLQVDALELGRSGIPGEHTFEILLTQVAIRRDYIKGEVRLDIVGAQNSSQVVKSLTDLNSEQVYPLKFKFRYFQDITGTFVLDEDFEPERVLITASQNGKAPLQVGFPWPVD